MAEGQEVGPSTTYAKMLGTTTLPDLRGVFVRGLNSETGGKDPDDRVVGGQQTFATTLPRQGFSGKGEGETATAGEHSHQQNGINHDTSSGMGGSSVQKYGKGETSLAGEHLHHFQLTTNISGGDVETRPVNVALYAYIKIDDHKTRKQYDGVGQQRKADTIINLPLKHTAQDILITYRSISWP